MDHLGGKAFPPSAYPPLCLPPPRPISLLDFLQNAFGGLEVFGDFKGKHADRQEIRPILESVFKA